VWKWMGGFVWVGRLLGVWESGTLIGTALRTTGPAGSLGESEAMGAWEPGSVGPSEPGLSLVQKCEGMM
jgi:hypothetical protein